MPSPTTALEIIRAALNLTNAVGTDQTLTALEVSDCLGCFNDLIEDWSTQKLAVFGQANQTFSTIIGQDVYSIATGFSLNATRPVRINSAYSIVSGATFPCIQINQEQYDAIPVKTQTQDYPTYFLYVNDFPMGLVTLWPIPSAVTSITFSIDRVLDQIASAGTTLSFPPGYSNAFVQNLALALGPLFGKKMANYPDLQKEADETLGNIKRANKQPNIMRFDSALVGRRSTWQGG